ncbi:MAG: hypothetical protein DLM59_17080, partial [Pseudonocardiales bacterium]
MPGFPAPDRAPAAAGNVPVATSASPPPAAAVTVSDSAASDCAAANSAARRGRPAAGRGVVPVTIARTDGPAGTSGTPAPASRSANSSSGGAHTR